MSSAWNYIKYDEHTTAEIEIHNLSSWFDSERVIDSIIELPKPSSELRLELHPQPGECNVDKRFLMISVELLSARRPEIPLDLEYEISVINSNGVKTSGRNGRKSLNEGDRFSEAFEYLRSDLPLPNDQIKIQCNFSCFELVKLSKQGIDLTSESSLNDDLNDILRSAKWSDIILTCEGEEFKVHKLILSARSKVFAGMFRHKMAETKNHRVDIKDMGKEVLRQMLMYIYTDKTDNLDEVANGLLLAADMYDLGKLRLMCEASLSAKLSVENAAETLILADKHSAKQLKKRAIQFIVSHRADVIKTPAWKGMLKNRTDLVFEAFQLK